MPFFDRFLCGLVVLSVTGLVPALVVFYGLSVTLGDDLSIFEFAQFAGEPLPSYRRPGAIVMVSPMPSVILAQIIVAVDEYHVVGDVDGDG